MKSIIIVSALVVLSCMRVQAEGGCEVDGKHIPVGGTWEDRCVEMTCTADGRFVAVACTEWHCRPGTQIGYKEMDLSKNYPECCPGPICAS